MSNHQETDSDSKLHLSYSYLVSYRTLLTKLFVFLIKKKEPLMYTDYSERRSLNARQKNEAKGYSGSFATVLSNKHRGFNETGLWA